MRVKNHYNQVVISMLNIMKLTNNVCHCHQQRSMTIFRTVQFTSRHVLIVTWTIICYVYYNFQTENPYVCTGNGTSKILYKHKLCKIKHIRSVRFIFFSLPFNQTKPHNAWMGTNSVIILFVKIWTQQLWGKIPHEIPLRQ